MNIDEYIRFEVLNKKFTIPPDTYSYSDVVRVSVLNEKAKYKERVFHLRLYFLQDHYHLGFYKIHIYLLE